MAKGGLAEVRVRLNPEVAHYLQNYKRAELGRLEERHRAQVIIQGDSAFAPGRWEVEQVKRGAAENGGMKPGEGPGREAGPKATEPARPEEAAASAGDAALDEFETFEESPVPARPGPGAGPPGAARPHA
jgi:hypothetical protein